MGANFSRIKAWIAEVLTASDLNAEFDNIVNNFDPDGLDDASATATAMQATADPYPGSVVSLPTSLRGELQRIRYVIKQITGQTYWYVDPAGGLLPRSYLAGLGLSNAADTAHDITVAAGACRDSTNAYDMVLASALTKQSDVTWAVGTNAGGAFPGMTSAALTYHCFIIRKDSDGTIDAGFDSSVTAANKPAGYTYYRRVGSLITDGSGNISQFYQWGDLFLYLTPTLDITTTNPGINLVSPVLYVPLGSRTMARINFNIVTTGITPRVYLQSPNVADMAPSGTAAPLVSYRAVSTTNSGFEGDVLTSLSSTIGYRLDNSDADLVVRISTLGWTDRRGRDD